ncbi:trypsin-like serine protease [Luteimicrobium subarcticum]|nr:trypsin-like serine protease [Luteimicrobium subarcticum]
MATLTALMTIAGGGAWASTAMGNATGDQLSVDAGVDATTDPVDSLTQQALAVQDTLDPQTTGPLWVDRSEGTVKVGATAKTSVKTQSRLADAAATAAGSGTAEDSLEVVSVKYTQAQLDQFFATLLAGSKSFDDAGLTLGRIGQRPSADAVAIELVGDGDSRDTATKVVTDLGVPADAVVVENGSKESSVNFSRADDSAPYSSSMNLTRKVTVNGQVTEAADCSAGPGVVIAGRSYIVTAGHCWELGQYISTGRSVVLPDTPTTTQKIGAVAKRSWMEDYGVDAELIALDSSLGTGRAMYTTWSDKVSMSATIKSPIAGTEVCANGAFTGARCSMTVNGDYVNYCKAQATQSGPMRFPCGLFDSYRGEGQGAGEGDSGGPIYFAASPRQYVGIITSNTGRGSAPTRCDTFADLKYSTVDQPYRACSNDVTGTTLTSILTNFSASLGA